MPLKIVRNDITQMNTEAIVNTANAQADVGSGCDYAVYMAAGYEKLLQYRKENIGFVPEGGVFLTPGFKLQAKYIIHAVSPVYLGGEYGEEEKLRSCYRKSLQIAKEHRIKSISFPLISTGGFGYPKEEGMRIAIDEIHGFLLENEMQIYLVVFGKEAFVLSEKLFKSVSSYIDENYIHSKTLDEYGTESVYSSRLGTRRIRERQILSNRIHGDVCSSQAFEECFDMPAGALAPMDVDDWGQLLQDLDAGFSETLLQLIDRTGKKDSEIYKKANVDRKLFSKIRNNMDYKPSKTTALAFAFALELDLDETKDFIGRAGFALSHSSKFDVIVEYFLVNKNYNVIELNEVLFAFDQPLIGA